MKKAVALTLTGFLLFSILFVAPDALRADTDKCFDEYKRCRSRAKESDAGIIMMTLMLTVCDIALGTCLIANAVRK